MSRATVADVVNRLLATRESGGAADLCLVPPYLDTTQLRAALAEHDCTVRASEWCPDGCAFFIDSVQLNDPLRDHPERDIFRKYL